MSDLPSLGPVQGPGGHRVGGGSGVCQERLLRGCVPGREGQGGGLSQGLCGMGPEV